MRIHLEAWRKKRVLSIKMLSKVADVTEGTIINIEKNKHTPKPETLHKLADALRISIEELVTDEDEVARVA